jgi:RHS repeat-associated protein
MPSTATPVPNTPPTDEKYLPIEDESLEGAREAVKLDIPNLHSRLVREHRDPQFRNRLRAQVVGGVLRITPTPASGGGRPGWLPVPAEAQLRAVYVYDAFNRRTTTVLVGDSVRYYAWDGWRNVLEAEHVYDGASPATWQAAPLKQFVWGAELDELVSYRRKVPTTAGAPAWETYFVLHGGQETAAKLVDAAGAVVEQYEYDPYGRATCYSKVAGVWTPAAESRFGLPFLWKGVRLDEVTGLLQMRNRYYSVETGRFLTRDPLGAWADPVNCGNEFSYVGNMPKSLADPLGLISTGVCSCTQAGGIPRYMAEISEEFWDFLHCIGHWRLSREAGVLASVFVGAMWEGLEQVVVSGLKSEESISDIAINNAAGQAMGHYYVPLHVAYVACLFVAYRGKPDMADFNKNRKEFKQKPFGRMGWRWVTCGCDF